jgi:hypothetical protein
VVHPQRLHVTSISRRAPTASYDSASHSQVRSPLPAADGRACASPSPWRCLKPASLLHLQATFGNEHVQRMLSQWIALAPD